VVFLLSIFCCLFFLLLERSVGIGWDFHPDAVTYTQKYLPTVLSIFDIGISAVPNNLYYLISYLAIGNVAILIILNIFFYSLTNVLIAKVFKMHLNKTNWTNNKKLLLLLLLLLTPYRLHLAIHVLKDTLIIYLITFIIYKNKLYISSFVHFTFMFLLRIFSITYSSLLFPRKVIYYMIPLVLFVIILNIDLITVFLLKQNELKMTFREFDSVPNFSNFGVLGILLRAILWPIFVLTGAFIILSPSIAYFPIALGAIMLQLWSLLTFKKLAVSFVTFSLLSLLAMLVTGFTSYIRYTLPIVIVLPLILIKNNGARW